jgi:hypothetical protein
MNVVTSLCRVAKKYSQRCFDIINNMGPVLKGGYYKKKLRGFGLLANYAAKLQKKNGILKNAGIRINADKVNGAS